MCPPAVQVSAALQEEPLRLDLRQAPEEDLQLLLPLLTALPLGQLVLAPRHSGSAESLLRCDAVAAASAASLRRLAATVACTDTLQRYLRLEELHLHAGVLGRLYPGALCLCLCLACRSRQQQVHGWGVACCPDAATAPSAMQRCFTAWPACAAWDCTGTRRRSWWRCLPVWPPHCR